MKGAELYQIRKRLNLSRDEFAMQLGYRGNENNNERLIRRYEDETKQIPLTVASLAWLIARYAELADGELPDWPEWEGYDAELRPLKPDDDDPAGGPPAIDESDSS